MYRAFPRVCFGGAAVCSHPPGHRSVGRRDNIILVAKICVKCVFVTHFTHFTGGGAPMFQCCAERSLALVLI